MSKTYSAGIVTAYGAAKRAGYQGTYEDFCRQQAGYAESAATVEQAKNTAVSAANTATTKAGEASKAATAAQTAKTQTEAAASQALTDISSARSSAVSAVQTEGVTQTANATAQAQAAAQSATIASTKASEASVSATNAGQSATNAAASATAAAQIASSAQDVLDSIPADYSDLSANVSQLQADLANVTFPLKLVATYQGKQARATGLSDSPTNTVYQFEVPDNCETVHITSYFFGNSRIIFTNSATPIDFTTGQYKGYPSTGYNNPTDIDDDYATLHFKYVYVTFLVTEGRECKASCSALDIINFIGSNTPIAENTNGNITDFNDAKRNHIYVIASGISSISNYPPIPNGGTLLCFAAYTIDNVQIFISNQSAVFFRRMWGSGSWSAWKQIITTDNVQSVVNSAVTESLDGYYQYNILSAFKNITCIGDSLTYSQVYTGASTSRQAYNPYPTVLAKRCGATETILAKAGDTASQAWDRNGGNIVQKDAQLTIIYLGTNGGLTDTIDTDCVGDDYTQWSNTNTGCYAKLIAKSLSVGSRVVLVKIHSNSDLATTNNVIEKMGAKFGVPVIENTYLSGTKYHSYPDGSGTNGTHYNDFGYAVFADQIANSISQLSAEDAVKIIPI